MEIGVVLVVLLALAFDYTNGFHDAANSIATVVSTRVLSPRWAVAWAAFFNFAAFALGLIITIVIQWAFHRVRRLQALNRGFRRGQLFSAAAFSLGHGANDAQKTMGVILAVLIATKHLPAGADVPLWVVLAAHTAIGLG